MVFVAGPRRIDGTDEFGGYHASHKQFSGGEKIIYISIVRDLRKKEGLEQTKPSLNYGTTGKRHQRVVAEGWSGTEEQIKVRCGPGGHQTETQLSKIVYDFLLKVVRDLNKSFDRPKPR